MINAHGEACTANNKCPGVKGCGHTKLITTIEGLIWEVYTWKESSDILESCSS